MGRKAKTNPNYRSKETMAHDLAVVLNADVSAGTKYGVCIQIAWEWTELSGKYKGCVFWSKKAYELWQANPGARQFRHEHAVPKKVVIDILLKLERPEEALLYQVCDAFLIGIVVTVEEDKLPNSRFQSTMPPEFGSAGLDPLLRYKQCGIEVVQVSWPNPQ